MVILQLARWHPWHPKSALQGQARGLLCHGESCNLLKSLHELISLETNGLH